MTTLPFHFRSTACPAKGPVRPGTKTSRIHSCSSSSEGPTGDTCLCPSTSPFNCWSDGGSMLNSGPKVYDSLHGDVHAAITSLFDKRESQS
jgi:hypothetical protein